MVWNYQNADCSFKNNKSIVLFIVIFWYTFVPYQEIRDPFVETERVFGSSFGETVWSIYETITSFSYLNRHRSTRWVRKKQDIKQLPITSRNVNRFSKFFQDQTFVVNV